jgi:aminopeptidase N
MVQAMRQAVGDVRFFAFLRQYVQDNAGHVATAADFWRAYAAVGGEPTAIKSLFFVERH